MKENTEIKQLLISQNNKPNVTNNVNNISNVNNKFNLNVYLNETCKDAINITEFVNSLVLSINDLEETARLGYAEGISKIFINGLNNLDVNKRPVHCSDVKREVLYIKEDDKWNKETETKPLLTLAIKQLAGKNIKQISEWRKLYPHYSDPSSKQNDKYNKLIFEAMSGSTKEETDNNYKKIISNVSKHTAIDKVLE